MFIFELLENILGTKKQEAHGSWFAHLSKTVIAYLQMSYNFLQVLPHFPHTRVCGCIFDLVLERSMIILGSSFDYTWWTLSPRFHIPRYSLEAFLVREKKILGVCVFCFFSCMGITAILFNDAERFEQIDNMPTTEGPKCNLVKTGQLFQRRKRLKITRFYTYIHIYIYIYIAQRQGQITQEALKLSWFRRSRFLSVFLYHISWAWWTSCLMMQNRPTESPMRNLSCCREGV